LASGIHFIDNKSEFLFSHAEDIFTREHLLLPHGAANWCVRF